MHELADLAELMAWANGSVSEREILALLGREGENENNDGCEDDDDRNADAFGGVANEFEFRQRACAGRYPFCLDSTGNVLRYDPIDEVSSWLYGYLLLSTRLNMQADRTHANIDGTELLEEISATGLRQYLGSERSRALVFGTAMGSANFVARVTLLCNQLGEGFRYKNNHRQPNSAKDDKLDVVAWLPFSDEKNSKVIVFGQCKTGTAWTEQLCRLKPDVFIKKWIDIPFVLDPLRAYFVSESASHAKWSSYALEGGLLFDRCRLIDCCDEIEVALLNRIVKWSKAALKFARPML
ncbi:MAG: hypothetical protein IPO38_10100 [Rhodocyclaceae bacterium]|nr:hypothetical protein [Rhodocyclaceae bacterium]